MKFSIKDFFSKFTKEILNEKLHFLCGDIMLRSLLQLSYSKYQFEEQMGLLKY